MHCGPHQRRHPACPPSPMHEGSTTRHPAPGPALRHSTRARPALALALALPLGEHSQFFSTKAFALMDHARNSRRTASPSARCEPQPAVCLSSRAQRPSAVHGWAARPAGAFPPEGASSVLEMAALQSLEHSLPVPHPCKTLGLVPSAVLQKGSPEVELPDQGEPQPCTSPRKACTSMPLRRCIGRRHSAEVEVEVEGAAHLTKKTGLPPKRLNRRPRLLCDVPTWPGENPRPPDADAPASPGKQQMTWGRTAQSLLAPPAPQDKKPPVSRREHPVRAEAHSKGGPSPRGSVTSSPPARFPRGLCALHYWR